MDPPSTLLGPLSLRRPAQPQGAPPPLAAPPASQKSPLMDLFFAKGPYISLIKEAWNADPLTTLKLICHRRAAGKNSGEEHESFITAMVWLSQQHPLTVACNVKIFANFGRLRDLLEILRRVLHEHRAENVKKREKKRERKMNRWERERRKSQADKVKKITVSTKEKAIARAKYAVEMYKNNWAYRYLHNRISELFAELLRSDLQFLKSGEIEKISLASKWCPSLDSSYDKSTLICECIARNLFPRDSDIAYRDIEEAHYAYRVRDRLRKEVLVPLRKVLAIGETQKRFYTKKEEKEFRVYQKAYTKLFSDSDDLKFGGYTEIADVCDAIKSLPHEIIASINGGRSESEVAELQWQRLVDDLLKNGKLKNCLAISNVSEAMKGTQMDFSIAMGLLISELNDYPWKGKALTYGSDPKLCKIEGDSLESKVKFMRNLKSGSNIVFSKVFDQVLQVALNENLSSDKMVKRIFVFTDIGIEKAANNFWGVWASLSKFKSKGFKELPEIVFWNLRDAITSPGMKHKGVVIVNGFSKSTVTMFLKTGVVPTMEDVIKSVPRPEDVMNSAISRDEFEELVVFD